MEKSQESFFDESVGKTFSNELLVEARDKTLAVINEASKFLKPGISENELKEKLISIQNDLGIEKAWHSPQVRFGENTLMPYGFPGEKNQTLKDNDIAFLDLGLLYKGHEGDVGRAFYVGNDPEMTKCCRDVESLWHKVKDKWTLENQISGKELYEFANFQAEEMGWKLNLNKANGHRISDFPHIVRNRKASIQDLEFKPAPNRWILEIQIAHPERKFGAFYEDLL